MAKVKSVLYILITTFLISCESTTPPAPNNVLPEGFVYLQDIDPTIIQEIRYAGNHNLVGKPITGYRAPKCILTKEAAQELSKVQTELRASSMTLKVYDCYRPRKAMDSIVAWTHDPNATKMKDEFYPHLDKTEFFKDGYMSEKSGHSRGSTVDLTLVPLPVPDQPQYQEGDALLPCIAPSRFGDNSLDFGTGFDCFDPLAFTTNPDITHLQNQNRVMLKTVMENQGFKNAPEVWWHYTLANEPFPERYFDFDVF